MRAWLLTAAAALAVMTIGPAHAADVAQLGCIASELSPSDAKAWLSVAEALEAGLAADPPAAAEQALERAGNTCAARYGWTPRIAKAATELFVTTDMATAATHVVTSDGVDAAAVQAAARTLGEQDRQAVLKQEHAGNLALDAALRAHGIAAEPSGLYDALMLGAITVKLDDARARFASL